MRKLVYLEGLRGIAALIVVFSHFVQFYYPRLLFSNDELAHNNFERWLSETPINLLYNGNLAVCIFFVLSGYVLSLKYLMKKDINILIETATKRYFRLAIPISFSILLGYVVAYFGLIYYGNITEITNGEMSKNYELNHNFFGLLKLMTFDVFYYGVSSYNPALWTMKIELVGSFVVFLLLPLIAIKKKIGFQIVIFIIISIITIRLGDIYYFSFVAGMILCDLKQRDSVLFKINKILKFPLLVLGIYLASFPYVIVDNTIYQYLNVKIFDLNPFILSHCIGAILILIVLLNSTSLQKVFSSKAFEYLGKISFSVYLTHFVVLFSFTAFSLEVLVKAGLSYNFSFIISFVLSMIIILILSHYMQKYVDTFSIKLSKKIYTSFKRIFNKNTINLNSNDKISS
ncbi:acyltransferase family protein [Lysinibacillus fusiformis]|uniref:acyltransferase family protein n=1 Tax=Lysinibacillus fusiformis TaxID=28031 RepID=UPI003D057876